MRTIDLNEQELGVLGELVTKNEVKVMEPEHCRKIRLDRRVGFLELWRSFLYMTPEERGIYLNQIPGQKKSINLEDEPEGKAHLKDSVMAILGMDQEKWNLLPDDTQAKVLEQFELIREAGQEISRKEIDSRTPEDIRTILTAPRGEWEALPDSLTDAVAEKFEQLAG